MDPPHASWFPLLPPAVFSFVLRVACDWFVIHLRSRPSICFVHAVLHRSLHAREGVCMRLDREQGRYGEGGVKRSLGERESEEVCVYVKGGSEGGREGCRAGCGVRE
eukprot:2509881-Pleurochrysis_carterae.AAC.1